MEKVVKLYGLQYSRRVNIFKKMFQLGATQNSNKATNNITWTFGKEKSKSYTLKSNKSNFLFFQKFKLSRLIIIFLGLRSFV